MSSRQTEKEQRRAERLAAERDAAAAARRRRLGLIGAGVAAAVVAIVVVVVLVASGGSDDSGSGSAGAGTATSNRDTTASASLPGAQTGPPPWDAGNGPELQGRLDALGLAALPAEGTVVHIHQHLDLFVDGKHVTVPAAIGIDAGQQFIAALHTHDPSGVLHVESPEPKTFTLGQFFGVWGVPLSHNQIGGLMTGGGKELRTWVNGKGLKGDPAKIDLASHQEIVIAYGSAAQMPKPVPSSYSFPAGE
jgi:hypothetical protein